MPLISGGWPAPVLHKFVPAIAKTIDDAPNDDNLASMARSNNSSISLSLLDLSGRTASAKDLPSAATSSGLV